MIATLDMYEITTKELIKETKRGRKKRFVWISRVGPIATIHPSEMSACRYLEKLGFRLKENMEWEWQKVPEFENYIEKHYSKII